MVEKQAVNSKLIMFKIAPPEGLELPKEGDESQFLVTARLDKDGKLELLEIDGYAFPEGKDSKDKKDKKDPDNDGDVDPEGTPDDDSQDPTKPAITKDMGVPAFMQAMTT